MLAVLSNLAAFESKAQRCQSSRTRELWRMVLGPLLLYTFAYSILTFPQITQFNRLYFTDAGDGPQMIWDLWWVRYSLLTLHRWPWDCRFVFFPGGSPLWLHSLHPLNGLLSTPLSWVLSPIQTFNVFVVKAFAASALAAFWLCHRATRSYWASVAGGWGFAFCSFRWAHSFGHLGLITTEWMVLFVYAWLNLLDRPRIWTAVGAAVSLLLALLCDQYQFPYCVIFAATSGLWAAIRNRAWPTPPMWRAMLVFAAIAAAFVGPVILATLRQSNGGLMARVHNPEHYAADILGPWIPDWTWVYHGLTQPLWDPNGSPSETSVCLGPVLIVAAGAAMLPRRGRLRLGSTGLFAAVAILFISLSFGPTWCIWTIPVTRWTPYRILLALAPPLKNAGCPGRMIVMAQLATAVLAAAGVSRLGQLHRRMALTLAMLFALGLIIESQPRLLATFPPSVPPWVTALRDAPGDGAVIDLLQQGDALDLYYQTIHHRPIYRGDLSRVTVQTLIASIELESMVDRGEFDRLSQMGFGYIVAGTHAPPLKLPLVYCEGGARVFALPQKDAAARRP